MFKIYLNNNKSIVKIILTYLSILGAVYASKKIQLFLNYSKISKSACIKKKNNIDWLNTILHDDFLEIAKSGYVYSKKVVIDELTTEFKMVLPIFSQDFNIKWLDKNIALITYQSYEINKSGHPFNKALRSSIWQLSVSGTWQLRFHQGTIMAAQPLSNITL